MEVDAVTGFTPGNFVKDADLEKFIAQLEEKGVGFAPRDFVNDANIEKVTALLEEKGATLSPGNFVDDTHLPTVITLVSENSCRDADEKEVWRLVAAEHGKLYVDLDTDEEE